MAKMNGISLSIRNFYVDTRTTTRTDKPNDYRI